MDFGDIHFVNRVIHKTNSGKKYDLDKIIISSVVPEKNKEFIKYIGNYINTKIHLISYKDTDLKLNVENPASIGNDRICNIFAAIKLYNIPCLLYTSPSPRDS